MVWMMPPMPIVPYQLTTWRPWFIAKVALVIALSGYHGWMVGYGRKLAGGVRAISDKTLRLMNEVPGIAAILIVVLVVVGRAWS